jgi:hypothetical protein
VPPRHVGLVVDREAIDVATGVRDDIEHGARAFSTIVAGYVLQSTFANVA